jgi:hypothetical protein
MINLSKTRPNTLYEQDFYLLGYNVKIIIIIVN